MECHTSSARNANTLLVVWRSISGAGRLLLAVAGCRLLCVAVAVVVAICCNLMLRAGWQTDNVLGGCGSLLLCWLARLLAGLPAGLLAALLADCRSLTYCWLAALLAG